MVQVQQRIDLRDIAIRHSLLIYIILDSYMVCIQLVLIGTWKYFSSYYLGIAVLFVVWLLVLGCIYVLFYYRLYGVRLCVGMGFFSIIYILFCCVLLFMFYLEYIGSVLVVFGVGFCLVY